MPWRETCAMEQRMKFVMDHIRQEVTVAELCRWYAISRKTGYKWLERYRTSGAEGLKDLSRAPHRCPHAMTATRAAAVLTVKRRYPTWGPRKVRAWLERHGPGQDWPAASTIGDLFRRRGLVVTRRRRHRTPPRSAPFATCDAPNDVWCADFKGWFRTADGARCEPFTLSDAHSRYLLRCQAVPRTDVAHVWPIFDAAFREFGIPRTLRSDNGPPFASVAAGGLAPLSVLLIKAEVMPERIDPGKPSQNGRHERMHRTLKAETCRAASVLPARPGRTICRLPAHLQRGTPTRGPRPDPARRSLHALAQSLQRPAGKSRLLGRLRGSAGQAFRRDQLAWHTCPYQPEPRRRARWPAPK